MVDWSRHFDEPIPLPRGRQLVILKDAANYIQKLPKAEQDLEEWHAAVEALLLVVELSGPAMMARIGVVRALNRGYVREFGSSRKDTHRGGRKLARDRNALGYVHRRQWSGRSRHEVRVSPHRRREHHKRNNNDSELTHS